MKGQFILILSMIISNYGRQAEVLNVHCNYSKEKFGDPKDILCCNYPGVPEILSSSATLNITNSKLYDSRFVKAFSVKNKNFFHIPSGIGNSFSYIEALEVYNSGLRQISSQNLKQFEYLKYLGLSNNEITYLPAKLFEHNFKIETVILNNNKINLVEPTAFKPSHNINLLAFESNLCYSGTARYKDNVENMIEIMKISCSGKIYSLQNYYEDLHRNIANFGKNQSKSEGLIDILIARSAGMAQNMSKIEKEIKELRGSGEGYAGISSQISKISDEIEKLRTCPENISNLNKTVVEVCEVKAQKLENKYTGILNQTTKLKTDLQNLNIKISDTEKKNAEFSNKLSSLLSNYTNVINGINEINKDIKNIKDNAMEKQKIPQLIKKSANELENSTVKKFTELRSEIEVTKKQLKENYTKDLKNVSKIVENMQNKFATPKQLSEAERRLKTDQETSSNIANKKIEENGANIEALAKALSLTSERSSIVSTQIKNLTEKDAQISSNLIEVDSNLKKLSDNIQNLQNNTNNFDFRIKNLSQNLQEQINNLSQSFEVRTAKNEGKISTMGQISADQTPSYVKYLIISNITLIILLIITISFLVYNFRSQINLNHKKHSRPRPSTYQQFTTMTSHVPLYELYTQEPMYATTTIEEPIYNNPSLYEIEDAPIYEAADAHQYGMADDGLYEATDISTCEKGNAQLYRAVNGASYSGVGGNIYETTDAKLIKEGNALQIKAANVGLRRATGYSIRDTAVHESGTNSIYETANCQETQHKMKTESATSINASEEELYSEIPTKLNDEHEKVNESDIYSVVHKI